MSSRHLWCNLLLLTYSGVPNLIQLTLHCTCTPMFLTTTGGENYKSQCCHLAIKTHQRQSGQSFDRFSGRLLNHDELFRRGRTFSGIVRIFVVQVGIGVRVVGIILAQVSPILEREARVAHSTVRGPENGQKVEIRSA